jgi:photosystem II stability/assembly factor-like uncharacterized protein
MQTMRLTSSSALPLLFVLLSACGGADGDPGAPGANGLSALMTVSAEAPGARCARGGSKIDAGLDADRDGTLGVSEISSTQYVCNGTAGAVGTAGAAGAAGAPGSNALSTLVQMLDEPSGAQCATGGKAISAGLDSNANGVLDAGEVSSTGYVCNGSDGANGRDGGNGTNGSNGTNGLNTLASIVSEPAGANCPYGGSKVSIGSDGNANNALDVGEVAATSYLCDGAPGATLNWVSVTGTAVQAQSNTGYVASNDTAQVVVTLPADPAVGDVLRISGAGLGGWKIAQNAGQGVDTHGLGDIAGANWTARESSRVWQSVALSADGSKIAAAANELPNGAIYTSIDGGATWAKHVFSPLSSSWWSVASSADGRKLVAAVDTGRIYTSTDGGASWTARDSNRSWSAAASSSDGSKLIASESGGRLYTSTDSGVTWTAREAVRAWRSVASSADGSRLVAAHGGGQLYTSTDSGVTWTARDTNRLWYAVASSADGTQLVAAAHGGAIYTSSDSGANWVARQLVGAWTSVASSADGNKLVAVAQSNHIYTSVDGGVTWAMRTPTGAWASVASSVDGSKVVALGLNTQIQTSTAATTTGTGGSISGNQLDAITLQYVGNGMFTVLNHEGSLTAE